MRSFEYYFSFDIIVDFLVKQRVKISFQTHKQIYLNRILKINDDVEFIDLKFLQSILPPRKKWSRPNTHNTRQKLNTAVDINVTAIKNSIYKIHRKFLNNRIEFLETPLWYQNLRKYIFEIKLRVFQDENLSITPPTIIPKEKEKGSTTMRPIANFCIDDKLILGLTNKYLTSKFDLVFLDNSTAFRQRIGVKKSPRHHDVIKEIKEYRVKHIGQPLYVAECDIKKFFDCVYHKIIVDRYEEIKAQLNKLDIHINERAEKIFNSYLKCYSFNKMVLSKNQDKSYWMNFKKKPESQFGWSEHLVNKQKNGEIDNELIGIPQGGALSGLIANIIMHNVDKKIVEYKESKYDSLLYKRYCDDMIIIHKDAKICQELFELYKTSLRENLLEYHEPISLPRRYGKLFWAEQAKSKNTYYWNEKPSPMEIPQSKWLNFLGYMINYKGDLKIRKKSLDKQIQKHEKELRSVIFKLNEIKPEELKKNQYSILYSFKCKLYSMAVGKVNLSNYKNEATKMCWGDGFKLIDNNKYLRKQLRKLDYSRGKTIGHLNLHIKRKCKSVLKKDSDCDAVTDIENYIKIGYPHSFYSLLERTLT